jgi:hypothetical protein
MSSFTSSSDTASDARNGASPCPYEWKVLVGLLLMMFASEGFLRLIEMHLSKDVQHIRQAPEIARRIGLKQEASDASDVLFLGNSSIRAGVLPEVLTRELSASGAGVVRPHFFHPDGGAISAWYWGWRRYFAGHCKPDLVVLCGGRAHFDDLPMSADAAANYFVSWHDVPLYVLRSGLALEDRLAFLAAKFSRSYGSRARFQRRFMDMILPYNREVLFDMVQVAKSKESPDVERERAAQSRTLVRLLKEMHQEGVSALVVALPHAEGSTFDENRKRDIEAAHARWADLRELPGIRPDHYYDKAHLNEQGAQILTRALAVEIGNALMK